MNRQILSEVVPPASARSTGETCWYLRACREPFHLRHLAIPSNAGTVFVMRLGLVPSVGVPLPLKKIVTESDI
jgi:hypothetical protein